VWRAALDTYIEAGVASPYWALLGDCSQLGPVVTRGPAVLRLLRKLRDDPVTGGSMRTFQPQLRAALPDTWFAKESITLLAPDGGANIIASSEPLDPGITTEEYTRTQGDVLHQQFPGFEEAELREPSSSAGGAASCGSSPGSRQTANRSPRSSSTTSRKDGASP
jgi:hypothetical protein